MGAKSFDSQVVGRLEISLLYVGPESGSKDYFFTNAITRIVEIRDFPKR